MRLISTLTQAQLGIATATPNGHSEWIASAKKEINMSHTPGEKQFLAEITRKGISFGKPFLLKHYML